MKRRRFIQQTSAAAIALATPHALAIEPFARPKPGQLRLSLAAYSLRKYLQPQNKDKVSSAAEMDLFEFVDFCFEQGLAGAELTSYYFPDQVTHDYLLKLKQHCHLRGITISGGAIRNDFCSSDASQLAQDLAHTRQWVDHYAVLGAPAIRIFAGKEVAGEELKVTLARCAANCETACEYAASKGVMLALENHGGVTAKASDLLQIVQAVKSPALGINFDSGNFRSGDDPYQELELIAPYAVNAQIKVEMTVGGKKTEADLERIVKILRDAGYSGWVALEYEAAEEPLDAIPRWLDKLRPLLDA
jgi:sugar phosphate isomerase/epimerase